MQCAQEEDQSDASAHRAEGELSQPHTKSLTAYLTKLARLGGYLARAHDPPPGNKVMRLSRLTDIELGAIIGAQLVGN
jgi:hypothetical protein